MGTFLLPPGSSTVSGDVDRLFYFILAVTIFFFVLVVALTIYFTVKYRRKGEVEKTAGIDKNIPLEIAWTAVPLILVIIIFAIGFKVFIIQSVAPGDSIEVKVTGQQWLWTFTYPDGSNSTNDLVVPVNKSIKLLMSSRDVIHGFYVPDFRIKLDVVPNHYTVMWFKAPKTGDHDIFCTQYCGTGHSSMLGKVKVVSETDYAQWLKTQAAPATGSPVELGKQLYQSKGCSACHTIDGSPSVGPTWKGVYGSTVPLSNGSSVKADENYIRESILVPGAKIVKGFPNVMPTFQGTLKDTEIDALVGYIKSLGGEGEK